MQTKTGNQKYANTIFAINLMAGILLFVTVAYFYDGLAIHKAFLSASSLIATLSLAIVNRRDILRTVYI